MLFKRWRLWLEITATICVHMKVLATYFMYTKSRVKIKYLLVYTPTDKSYELCGVLVYKQWACIYILSTGNDYMNSIREMYRKV